MVKRGMTGVASAHETPTLRADKAALVWCVRRRWQTLNSGSARRSFCSQHEGVPVKCFGTVVAFAALTVAAAAVATPAAAQAPVAPSPQPHTITVTGRAQVKPEPGNPRNNASITKAVRDARSEAVPLAIANGRARAAELSRLSGLALGALVAIAEAGPGAPFFFGPYGGEDGTFGPGQYCGTVRRPIFRVDAQGRRRVVRRVSRRQCRVPRFVSANLSMVFSTA